MEPLVAREEEEVSEGEEAQAEDDDEDEEDEQKEIAHGSINCRVVPAEPPVESKLARFFSRVAAPPPKGPQKAPAQAPRPPRGTAPASRKGVAPGRRAHSVEEDAEAWPRSISPLREVPLEIAGEGSRPASAELPELPELPEFKSAQGTTRSSSALVEDGYVSGGGPAWTASRVVLEQWSLEVVARQGGEKVVVVRGIRRDAQGATDAVWRTCEIMDVVTPTLLVTRKTAMVELVGPLSRPLARQLRVPARLVRSFADGFPKDWREQLVAPQSRGRQPGRSQSNVKAGECSLEEPSEHRTLIVPPPQPPAPAVASRVRSRPPPKRTSSAWTEEELANLQQALAKVRPSVPFYWRQVAMLVGRLPEECRSKAFGAGHGPPQSPPAKRRKCVPFPAAGLDVVSQPVTLKAMAQRDGPRRAQQLRNHLHAASFGASRDLLLPVARGAASAGAASRAYQPCASDEVVAPPLERTCAATDGGPVPGTPPQRLRHEASRGGGEDAVQAPDFGASLEASPSSQKFLDSLHTGLTPRGKQLPLNRKLVFQSPPRIQGRRDNGEEDELQPAALLSSLDLGDSTWQPKGVDSFICDARARRAQLGKVPQRPVPAPLRRQGLASRLGWREAPPLFRQVDSWGARVAACFENPSGPEDGASDSDDEVAPIATIPKVSQGLVDTPSVGSEPEDCDV